MNYIKGFMVIGLLAMLETAYASRPVIIQTPTVVAQLSVMLAMTVNLSIVNRYDYIE